MGAGFKTQSRNGLPALSPWPTPDSSENPRHNHLLRSAGSLSGRGVGRDYKVYREDVGGASHLPLITYFSLFSGQFLEELSKFSSIFYKLRAKEKESSSKGKRGLLRDQNPRGKEGAGLGGGMSPPGG